MNEEPEDRLQVASNRFGADCDVGGGACVSSGFDGSLPLSLALLI